MENQTIEYKREYKKGMNDNIIKSIIAFLNTDGGTLIIGMNDDGSVRGIEKGECDEIVRTLQDVFYSRIKPYIPEEVIINKEKKDDEKIILNIKIKSGNNKPYYDSKKGMIPEGIYYRENGMNRQMPKDKIESLYSRLYQKDISQIKANHQQYTIGFLENQFKREGIELTKIKLLNFGLINDSGEKTLIYQLLSDENSSSIKFNKYQDKTKSQLIESNQYGEIPLYETAKLILEKIKLLNDVETIITSDKRIERSKLDNISIREIILNAIVHNDYTIGYPQVDWFSDRIEVSSHGGLVIGMTREEFYAGKSVARNPQLVKIFDKLKFVESIGSGIDRVKECYDDDIFEITDNYFKVTIKFNSHKNREEIKNMLTLIDQVFYTIEHNNGVSVYEISEKINLSPKTIHRYVAELIEEEKVTRIKQGRKYIYFKK